ncbi:MAG TPA: hypothetical protein VM822_26630 [Pseudolabrys sp.]|nr:hypothetical protein [Pseudolabrys sp.]
MIDRRDHRWAVRFSPESGHYRHSVTCLLRPRLLPSRNDISSDRHQHATPKVATAVLGYIAGRDTTDVNELVAFLDRTYSGICSAISRPDLFAAMRALESDKLIYQIENSRATYAATKLGRAASFAGLSAETGGMFGVFLRAMIGLSQKRREKDPNSKDFLRRLSDLDLISLCLASFETRDSLLPKLKADQITELGQYLELLPPAEKPLMNLWRDPDSAEYPTRRLLSTLRFRDNAEGILWNLLQTGVMLREHSNGRQVHDLISKYGGYEGDFEGRLKPTVIWLSNSLAQICTGAKCYNLDFIAIKAYDLMRNLSVGGNLGKLLAIDGLGMKSINKLTGAGVRRFEDLMTIGPEALLAMGLRKQQVDLIRRATIRHGR